jgi:hypothetical protein
VGFEPTDRFYPLCNPLNTREKDVPECSEAISNVMGFLWDGFHSQRSTLPKRCLVLRLYPSRWSPRLSVHRKTKPKENSASATFSAYTQSVTEFLEFLGPEAGRAGWSQSTKETLRALSGFCAKRAAARSRLTSFASSFPNLSKRRASLGKSVITLSPQRLPKRSIRHRKRLSPENRLRLWSRRPPAPIGLV